jgi:hypothetical protein
MGASFYGLRAEISGYHFSIPLGAEVLSNNEQSRTTIFQAMRDLRCYRSAAVGLFGYFHDAADFCYDKQA